MANTVAPDQTAEQSDRSLIWVYTVYPDLYVWKLTIITAEWLVN